MTNAFNCYKVKAVVLLDVARDLAKSEPWSPFFFNSPVKLLNPLLSTISRNCAISVT